MTFPEPALQEAVMEYALLEKKNGFWRFSAKNNYGWNRQWKKLNFALIELQEEGWDIAALYYAEFQPKFRAYGLRRRFH